MNTIEVRTRAREEFVNLTAEVGRIVASSGVASGICVVTVPHTTAGVTVNENADPDVRADMAMVLRKFVPDALPYAHGEGNSPAHEQLLDQPGSDGSASTRFSCDGRTRCPQMTSCEEATFFIQNCPGTEMDGDGDGIPCESQWCGR